MIKFEWKRVVLILCIMCVYTSSSSFTIDKTTKTMLLLWDHRMEAASSHKFLSKLNLYENNWKIIEIEKCKWKTPVTWTFVSKQKLPKLWSFQDFFYFLSSFFEFCFWFTKYASCFHDTFFEKFFFEKLGNNLKNSLA